MFVKILFNLFTGSYIIGLMKHGDLFIWNKDKDVLKTIPGLAGVVTSQQLQSGRHL